jgi:hypothetical protein
MGRDRVGSIWEEYLGGVFGRSIWEEYLRVIIYEKE